MESRKPENSHKSIHQPDHSQSIRIKLLLIGFYIYFYILHLHFHFNYNINYDVYYFNYIYFKYNYFKSHKNHGIKYSLSITLNTIILNHTKIMA